MSLVVTTVVLGAAVAAGATVTIPAYPAGTNQAFFTGANASADGVVVLNDNEVYLERPSGVRVNIAYESATIVITNNAAVTWAAGSTLRVQLGRAGNDRPGFVPGPAIADLAALDVTGTVNQTTVNTQLNILGARTNVMLRALRAAGIIAS